MKYLFPGLAFAFGLGLAGNGTFMLVDPVGWYLAIPGVIDTGPFNQHFLRDIGLIFLLIGGAFMVGAFRREGRVALWAASAIWLTGHACFHVWEVLAGICGPSVLVRDFPAVTTPALVAIALTWWAWRRSRTRPLGHRSA